MTLSELQVFKQSGEKITCLTAYDASFAKVFDACGIDIILIGDSLGNVIQGAENTLAVRMADMVYHTKSVAKGAENALLITDMPYQSYATVEQALKNAKRLMEAGAQMLKFEGGRAHESVFKILHTHNIPVCGHLGLQPQSIVEMGGYKVQGRDEKSATKIFADALKLEGWGVQALVLECMPKSLAQKISTALSIPTIGIGAGVDCDGQVLVSYDMLGLSQNMPKFVKIFLTDGNIKTATNDFIQAVKNGTFPTDKHSYI